MAYFHFEIDASATYSITAPTLEVLVDGIVVSSVQISQHTGSGLDYLRFELEYSGSYPGTLEFRFNDGAEGGRSIEIDSVRVNGWTVDTTYITLMNLNNGQTSSVNAMGVDYLFGRTSPVLVDLPAETITGTAGDDLLVGSTQPEIINAGSGADRVRGQDDDDAIFGGADNDKIFGAAGNDIIVGDDGDDSLYGEAGNDLLHGNDGNDTINGGDGHDLINGGAGNDTLIGAAGDDIIFGEDGVDTISGGAGNDYLFGDAGNDIIGGGIGNDTIYGGLDDDQIYGEAGDDILYGEGGNDTLYGGAGADTMYGNNGADVLYGGAGNDTLSGDAGDDILIGGLGVDTMDGGADNDTFNLANGDFAAGESITGGLGTDSIVLTNATTIDFSAGTLSGVETLTGSGGNDTATMLATSAAGMFTTINLDVGTDTLNIVASGTMNISAATLATISNAETVNLTGTSGNDALTLTGAQLNAMVVGSGTINLGAGANTLSLTSTSATLNGLADAALTNVQTISLASAGAGVTLTLSNQTEGFTITGSASADTITLGAGVNTLDAGGGNDTITLGNGAWTAGSSLTGSAGTDSLTLSNASTVDFSTGTLAGLETFTGSTGNDTVTVLATSAAGMFTTINLNTGTDVLNIMASGTMDISAATLATISNTETVNLTGSGGDDALTLTAAQLNAIIVGAGIISMGTGTDRLNLSGTSTDLNTLGATDASIVGLEEISFASAAAGVTLTLSGQTEGFTITGSASADTITLGTGVNIVDTGGGNDTINLDDGIWTAGSSLTGGAGTDVIVLTPQPTVVDFTTGTLAGFETMTGSGGGDDIVTIFATSAAGMFTSINLGAGTADTLNVMASGTMDISAATLATITNTEVGSLLGSSGNDTLTLTAAQLNAIIIGGGIISMGAGTDRLNLSATSADLNTLGASDALMAGLEEISFATAAAGVTLTLSGQNEAFTVTGSGNADTLTGGAGNDTIDGGGGNDTIYGGNGADILYGGAGNDTIYGEAANLTIISPATDTVFSVDISSVIHNNNQNATLTISMSLDGGSTYSDYVFSFKEGANQNPTRNNMVAGINAGDVHFSAVKGATNIVDITVTADGGLYGPLIQSATYNAANDPNRDVFGSILTQGADAVVDTNGFNTLSGGAGTDALYGDTDADLFLFEASTVGTNDTIYNFNTAQGDKLDIADILTGFTGGSSDPDDFAQFTVSGADLLLQVDANGTTGGSSYATVATLNGMGGSGLNIQNLYDNNILIMT